MPLRMSPSHRLPEGGAQTALTIKAARSLVQNRRWYMDLPADRPLPDALQDALDRAVAALDAAEADRGSPTSFYYRSGCFTRRHSRACADTRFSTTRPPCGV